MHRCRNAFLYKVHIYFLLRKNTFQLVQEFCRSIEQAVYAVFLLACPLCMGLFNRFFALMVVAYFVLLPVFGQCPPGKTVFKISQGKL